MLDFKCENYYIFRQKLLKFPRYLDEVYKPIEAIILSVYQVIPQKLGNGTRTNPLAFLVGG